MSRSVAFAVSGTFTPHSKAATQPAPHIVHVRYDSFLLPGERGEAPRFRMRVHPLMTDKLLAILKSFAPALDPDANIGFYLNFFGSPLLLNDFPGSLGRLQLEILKQTGIQVSIGAAKSKVGAAAASRLASPGGFQVITPGSEADVLAELPVETLHGIDSVNASHLRSRGIATVGELRRVPRQVLKLACGEAQAELLWLSSRALDALTGPERSASESTWGWLRAAASALAAAL